MGQFKPMVKMFTDEPSVILKLKKGGKVASKAAGQSDGFKSMASTNAKMFEGAEDGAAPKKPSHAARHKAMNPNQYAKGGKVAHKQLGGGMPMGAIAPKPPMAQPMNPMGASALGQMTPAQRAARAMMVRKALTGMKKGGSTHAECAKLEKELHHHEKLDAKHAHPQKKASGGAIDKAETRTTIEGNAKKFAKTKMDTAHKDKAHGTGEIHEGKPGGYATGGAIPADTNKKVNKGKIKMHGTIEGNEKDYVNTQMHQAKKDKAHGTGGIKVQNAGGYAKGGNVNWENRPADTAHRGVTNTKTGEVKESNAGGYKHGGHASKKAYATGGNVVDDGKAEKMPRHFVSRPVANSLQSGTFKKGGKVATYANGGSQKSEYDPDDFYDEYEDSDGRIRTRVKSTNPRYSETAVNKAISSSNRSGRKIGGKEAKAIHGLLKGRYAKGGEVGKFDDGGSSSDDQYTVKNPKAVSDKASRELEEALNPLSMAKELYGKAKNYFSPSAPPAGSVTKTEKSVTVSPGKKRGGKC